MDDKELLAIKLYDVWRNECLEVMKAEPKWDEAYAGQRLRFRAVAAEAIKLLQPFTLSKG